MTRPDDRTGIEDLLRHEPFLRRLAVALAGDGPGADDLVQETFSVALDGRPVRIDRPRAWLAGVLRNLFRTGARTAARRRRRETRAGHPPDVASSAEVAVRLERSRRIVVAVTELPEPYRSVVFHRWFDGLTPAEIAARTGTAAGTVRMRLHRALGMLRARLGVGREDRRRLVPLLTALGRPLVMSGKKIAFVACALVLVLAGIVAFAPSDRGLVPNRPDAASGEGTVAAVPAEGGPDADTAAEPASRGGVRVVDPRGRPVEGATVVCSAPAAGGGRTFALGSTDDRGRVDWRDEDLPLPGFLRVRHPDHAPAVVAALSRERVVTVTLSTPRRSRSGSSRSTRTPCSTRTRAASFPRR